MSHHYKMNPPILSLLSKLTNVTGGSNGSVKLSSNKEMLN